MQYVYDYARADGDYQLQQILETLRQEGYTLICVSQYEHTYTVFFRTNTQWWISVAEFLPTGVEAHYQQYGEYPEYIVMIENGCVPTTLFFDGEGWFDDANEYYRVTHWMPLPAPPGENNV